MAAMASLIKAIPYVDRDSKPPLSLKWRKHPNSLRTTTQISLINPSSMMIKNSSSSTTTTAAGFNIRTIKCSSSINNDRRGGSDCRVHNNSKKNGFSILKQPAALLGGFSQEADYNFRSSNYLLVPTNRKPFSIIGAEKGGKGGGESETNKEEPKEAGKESNMFSKFSSLKPFGNLDPRRQLWWLPFSTIGAEKGDEGGESETNKEELKEAGKESNMFSKFSLKPFGNLDTSQLWWLIGHFIVYIFATWRVVGVKADCVGLALRRVVGRVVGVKYLVGRAIESAVKSVVVATVMIVVVPLLLLLAVVFYIFTDPMYAFSSFLGTLPKILSAIYAVVVNLSFYRELSVIILPTSVVLATADATVLGSVKSQRNLLTMAGIVIFTYLSDIIPEPLVWVFLVGSLYYSRYVKRRDNISSALPSAVVLVAVGKRGLVLFVIVSYITLGIYQQKLLEEEVEFTRTIGIRIPGALLAAASDIDIQ